MAEYHQGLYDCIVRDQGFDVSSEKKTPYFWLRFLPVKHNGDEIEEGYEREVKLWLTDSTIERTVERLRSLGWPGTSFKELEAGSFSFAGTNIKVRCLHEQVDDKVYEKWEFPGGVTQSESRSGMGKKLDALFGRALKDTAKASQPKQAEQQVEEEEDDCPF